MIQLYAEVYELICLSAGDMLNAFPLGLVSHKRSMPHRDIS